MTCLGHNSAMYLFFQSICIYATFFGPHDMPWAERAGIATCILELRKLSLKEAVHVQGQGGK